MLDTRFPDPEARAKYFVQWITATNRHNEIVVLGYCVRSNKETLFKHKDKAVCEKVRDMLNEGA
jgi:hypothetical protein